MGRITVLAAVLSLAACSKEPSDGQPPARASASASPEPERSSVSPTTSATVGAAAGASAAWALVRAACPSGLFVSQPLPRNYGEEGQASYNYIRFAEDGTVASTSMTESTAGEDRKIMNESAARWLKSADDDRLSRGVFHAEENRIVAKITIAKIQKPDPTIDLVTSFDKPPYVFKQQSNATGHKSALKYACVP